jgi:hypothetical protein
MSVLASWQKLVRRSPAETQIRARRAGAEYDQHDRVLQVRISALNKLAIQQHRCYRLGQKGGKE